MAYKIGDIVSGVITGIQPYGAFVSLDDDTQGLIHISEIKYGFIKSIKDAIAVGDYVEVKVIDIDEYSQKISLSMRALDNHVAHVTNKRKKFFTNPRFSYGFSSIDRVMEDWIKDSLDSLKNNK